MFVLRDSEKSTYCTANLFYYFERTAHAHCALHCVTVCLALRCVALQALAQKQSEEKQLKATFDGLQAVSTKKRAQLEEVAVL